MKLSAPKFVTFLICVLAFIAGIVLPGMGILAGYGTYLIYGSFILLALACLLKGL